MTAETDWSGFTEAAFRQHLRALKAGGYRFIRFGQIAQGRQVLWRHDVDVSLHRAAALAAIEADEGVVATYFINPRSTFYNVAEPALSELVRAIAGAGHALGLHFDADAYGVTSWTQDQLVKAIGRERRLLELIVDAPVQAMSWHNPDLSNLLDFQADTIDGLINAYGRTVREDFVYASDSNGYWRFAPMDTVIALGHERLHLLTHPEWWTPQALSPSDRIDRAVQGRAHAVRGAYDAALSGAGRINLGKAP